MKYRRYDHVERFGHIEVADIEMGKVHVFPKLDGTNASVWLKDDGKLGFGSRNREITPIGDNQGFAAAMTEIAVDLMELLSQHPNWVIYGEWLVPHTLKTYRPEAWRKFYVFDVYDAGEHEYVPYEYYAAYFVVLPDIVQVLPPLCTIDCPSEAQLRAQVETNTYLVADGAGVGEGIVVKRYDWRNRFGRQPWAKVVRNEFREQNARAFGVPEKDGEFQVEAAIAETYCTPEFVGKTRAKVVVQIANETNTDLMSPDAQQLVEASYRARLIPRLLGVAFYDLVQESTWDALKKFKNPKIDFGLLQRHVTRLVKEYAKDLFA